MFKNRKNIVLKNIGRIVIILKKNETVTKKVREKSMNDKINSNKRKTRTLKIINLMIV